ncbi:MAG: glycosyltransferase family 2 protein [Bacteroidetes bacterium]|jgi:poly-beta-1,6-N-acetyl-D-glucosamine synthase|nr:glycosyltransferase family 2 protein [Bacteroidota bacterium]MBT3749962.1 glycosyltransferase family 2 protein [Bacteroidota bacterium]MBT4399486.1 glycosyltransferase family 2 protein [Bacteroidota bacterium]MBT4411843.1 glycosyltransferase family 2 protein [Bacteroidota bacterium]MBT7094014.1 glycosyltransferase family 2 protein [Bacteroidota bacterium]
MGVFSAFQVAFEFLITGITILIIVSYISLAIYSAVALRHYIRKNSFVDYNAILSCTFVPSISILAPAFNEGKTIIQNVRALLSLYYNDFEVVVINDGSTDNTLSNLIEEYDLEISDHFMDYLIPTQDVRAIYKSRNQSFSKLIVIDKNNGGKADSLNAGINLARGQLFIAIDVDSIIESDALLKMVKPFLEEKEKKVIATGGVIRVVNDCLVDGGQIAQINLPKKFLPRVQVLEYTRSFLMGRMAWSKLDGLLLISGALGLFDRQLVIDCGGYYSKTVGEDMEIVVRMRRYMVETNQPYEVVYIPDPLCWTEVPENLTILGRQRNRWTRGMIDTLNIHKRIFMNPKYGRFGVLGYPYWFLFEWLVHIIEFIGILYFVMVILFGDPNWSFFGVMFGFIYTFAVAQSVWSILFEELTYHKYTKRTDVIKLVFTAFLEPVFYHPFILYWAIRGNLDYLSGNKSWGVMVRKGFGAMRAFLRSF